MENKVYNKLLTRLNKMIDTVNTEVSNLKAYTSDESPLLDRDGDSYGISTITLNGEYVEYSIAYGYDKPNVQKDYGIRCDEDGEYFLDEDTVEFLKIVRRDCKRGMIDFQKFNPDKHEDENGSRKENYMNNLNAGLHESIQSFCGKELGVKHI